MKTGPHNRLRGPEKDRVAPDTWAMTGSTNYPEPSTIRGEAQIANYHKLRDLVDQWIDTAIDLDRLRRNQTR